MFDPEVWAAVPFHFWSVVFFILGAVVGSLLNVCIHRMPRGESIISPPSHCPSCGYSIPWYLNIPLVTWVFLRGKCRNCGATISVRYFLVELLTGIAFLSAWLAYGRQFPGVAIVCCLLFSGLIVATFIDFEHFIIPDEITLGGIAAGFLCSAAVPALHADLFTGQVPARPDAMKQSALGIAVGGGLIYLILRAGKLLFGRHHIVLEPGTRVVFTETSLQLPNQEVPLDELFYRRSDFVAMEAERVEMSDRCYFQVDIRLTPDLLRIGEDEFKPEDVDRLEVVTSQITLPREAMGLGDVKFMAAIGAFLGWKAVLFSLMASAILGSLVGVTLIALRKSAWSSRLPYGPYIAMAAAIWVLGGMEIVPWWFR